eukprot:g6507.t1
MESAHDEETQNTVAEWQDAAETSARLSDVEFMESTLANRRKGNMLFSEAEEFRTSVPHMARLGVSVLDVELHNEIPSQEAFLEANVENQTQRFTELGSLTNSGEMLVFDVAKMKTAMLRIRLIHGAACFDSDSIGTMHIPLWRYANPNVKGAIECRELFKRNVSVGKLTLRFVSHVERCHVPLKLLCCTWNLGNQQPSQDLDGWFRLDPQNLYDLIVISVQESAYRMKRSILAATSDSSDDDTPLDEQQPERKPMFAKGSSFSVRRLGHVGSMPRVDNGVNRTNIEADLLKERFEGDYLLVKSVTMGQIRMLIFAKTELYPTINSVKTATQATGVAGVGQNKGGVAVSFRIWDTHLCFVNSHLAAHQNKTKARNSMYESLLRGIKIDEHNMDLLTGFHHVFWMGDLNYRVDMGEDTESPSDHVFKKMVDLLRKENFDELIKNDQLQTQMEAGAVFHGFKEGKICFMPTFKTERVKGHMYTPRRLPAWCDRILWKSIFSTREAQVLDYYSVPEVSSSDHKPVAAFFKVPTIFYDHSISDENISIIVLSIKKLQADGLFLLKKTDTITATPPNPQVFLSVRGRRIYKTSVMYKKCDPVWRNAIRIKIRENDLEQLQHYRLMFRVVSRTNMLSGYSQTMGRGVLPLDTVNFRTSSKKFSFSFQIKLQYNSKDAGRLIGDIKISLKKQRSKADRDDLDRISSFSEVFIP